MSEEIDMAVLMKKFPSFSSVTPKVRNLYGKGRMELLYDNDFFVGIVGTRKSTTYGIKTADMFAGHISRRGHCVVSGLATGIDAAAHRGALARGGRTIGVSATGLDCIYPASNKKIYDLMNKSACILSEYPDRVDPQKFRFPLRNRIVAALSDLLIVIEAPQKSGALITTGIALELGVTVAVVPGSIFSFSSIGSNRLLEDGAIPLCSTNQLDEIIEMMAETKGRECRRTMFTHDRGDELRTNVKNRSEREDQRFENLSGYSSQMVHFLRSRRSSDIYEAAVSVGISITDAMDIMGELERQGIVRKAGAEQYIYVL